MRLSRLEDKQKTLKRKKKLQTKDEASKQAIKELGQK